MYYYLTNFLFFSMVGSFFEQGMKFFFFKEMKSGILTGPFVPIYGVGIVIILLVWKQILKKMKTKKWIQYLTLFLILTVLLTLLELVSGILIETLFHKTMWNYKKIPFHFGKYIALPISLGWGISACLFLRFIKPLTDSLLKKIPRQLVYFVFFCFLFDYFYTFFLKKLIH